VATVSGKGVLLEKQEYFATAVATVSGKDVLLKKQECFATAVATFFRPASKEGKGAPTQRGSGSFGKALCQLSDFCVLNYILCLYSAAKISISVKNKILCRLIPLILPLAVGGFSLRLFVQPLGYPIPKTAALGRHHRVGGR